MNHFDPTRFLEPPTFDVTPSARMVFRTLEDGGVVALQSTLQIKHMGHVRAKVPTFNGKVLGGLVLTDGPYSLLVVDSILPDDYQRRTVICMDSEYEDQRHKMLIASGLIRFNKKGESR